MPSGSCVVFGKGGKKARLPLLAFGGCVLFCCWKRKMATMNPFDLLGDDAEDPSQLIAAEQLKAAVAAATVAPAKKGAAQQRGGQQNKPAQLPTKPPPPAQAGELLFFFNF